jgi:hypothetical protein
VTRRAVVSLVAFAAALGAAAPAWAEGDGLYGRFEGDLDLRLSAGAAVTRGGPSLSVEAGARYLSTAGVYAHWADGLGTRGPLVARSVAFGIDVAPLFLARYASDAERLPARFDLLLDSLSFGVGVFWEQPAGRPMSSEPGLEMALGFAFPFLARATGPFLAVRGVLRWRDADLGPMGALAPVVDRGAMLSITLGWRQLVKVGIVDAGDGVRR